MVTAQPPGEQPPEEPAAAPHPDPAQDPAPLARPILARTLAELDAALAGRSDVGFVPTMGALHAGHARVTELARRQSGAVVVSIFVNPLQFGPGEDYASYPRTLDSDVQVAGAAGADVIFAPSEAEMYPPGYQTRVRVPGVSAAWDGAERPGHFEGVATVVLKLLLAVRPHRVYLGEKDWQQLAVLRRMVRDLGVRSAVVGVPTVRAESGLALSSRNSYFSPAQLERAVIVSQALRAVQAAYAGGERDAGALLAAGRARLAGEPALSLDYLALVDDNLDPVSGPVNDPAPLRLLIAARLFGVRLIDNMPLVATPAPTVPDHAAVDRGPPMTQDPQ